MKIWLLNVCIACTLFTIITGFALQGEAGYSDARVALHKWLGVLFGIVLVVARILLSIPDRMASLKSRGYQASLVAAFLCMTLGAHHGGELTHGKGFLTEYAFWNNPEEKQESGNIEVAIADSTEITERFHSEVLPIFEASCIECHGEEEQKSGLRLDTVQNVFIGGETGLAAIIPGAAESSHLVDLITHEDEDMRMPPRGDALTAEQVDVIKNWIQDLNVGTENVVSIEHEPMTTDLWSMQPVVKFQIPEDGDSSNPVDAFLSAKLKEADLEFSSSAEPHVLIRRASLTITGLLPSPEEIDSFEQEWRLDAEKAYANLVDTLLVSPHFGERWAQHWLDAIRWAESNGSESNYYRKNAWPYRDYLIDAFNDDKPYDQFIAEQIAGDVLGMDAATGFLVAGPHVPGETVGQEELAIKQARYDRMDETLQTVGSSVMGMTMSCARCHNHKFDPISIKDYYSMIALFQDMEYDHRTPKLPPTHPRSVAGRDLMREINFEREKLRKYSFWEERWPDHIKAHFEAVETSAIRVSFENQGMYIGELEAFGSTNSTVNFAYASLGTVARSSKTEESLSKPVDFIIDGQKDAFFGWRHKNGESIGKPWVEIEFPEPRTVARVELCTSRFHHYGTDFLSSNRSALPKGPYKIDIRDELGQWHTVFESTGKSPQGVPGPVEYGESIQRIHTLAARYDEEGPQPIFTGRFSKPQKTHLLFRGSPANPRDELVPAALSVIEGNLQLELDSPGPERRVALAQWLTSEQNPLTARVMVNRLWYHVFGTGIVETPSDFGNAGGKPTHPELLDWLASEFREQGWSVKHILRLMLTSKAFQQTSAPNERSLQIDGSSRLLWRFPPRWLDAEAIRDGILKSAGTLKLDIGGPSYRIHNIKADYEQWLIEDNAGVHTWRRMLYQERMRGVDDRMFTAFDFPDCGQIRDKRPRSTTPLQAFNLLNGDLIQIQTEKVVEIALGEASEGQSTPQDVIFKRVLGRHLTSEERDLTASLTSADDLRSLARALYNSNEFLYLQ
ncbi:MAG: DUF1553 domain-containing protein [Puniceicoccaceae bacterium]